MELIIHSLPGVFSSDHLDPGTAMLIENMEIQPDMKLLDVGCGYGILGMIASKLGAATVDLVDSDLLAIASTIENRAINQIFNARVYIGDLLIPVSFNKYDLILSNPPFHAGHSVDYQITISMIKQAYTALSSKGTLLLVANRFIPYDRLMKEIFGNVSCLVESASYRLLSGIK
jgi:16S rRNA (guanine1207-N2)-methyltransferase